MSREAEQQRVKIVEGLILAALIGMGGTLFAVWQAVTQLTVKMEYQADELRTLRSQFANVPELAQRVSRLEVRTDSNSEAITELREKRGQR